MKNLFLFLLISLLALGTAFAVAGANPGVAPDSEIFPVNKTKKFFAGIKRLGEGVAAGTKEAFSLRGA
jgi:hypothetical protein